VNRVVAGLLLIAATSLVLAGCSRRQDAWEEARAANTPAAYEQFLASYPEGEFASQARARAAELREAGAWQKAIAANTLDAYREFIRVYPDGRMSDEARIRIESFGLSAPVPESAPGLATLAGPTNLAPAGNVPSAAQTGSVAPQPPARGEGFRIQLGAFAGGEKQAMSEWRRLHAEFPALLQGLTPGVKLSTTTSGHLYRLQAGSMSEARARSICSALKTEGRACVVVLP
jgi:cell division septation protein DedD